VIAPPADRVGGGSAVSTVFGCRLSVGGRLGERGGRGGGSSRAAIRVDPTKNGEGGGTSVLTVTRGRSGLLRKRNGGKGGSCSGLTLPPSGKECEFVGADPSAHSTKAMIVLTTRARLCEVPSTRSSGKNRSSGGSPLPEHDARNFDTFDLRRMPSSCEWTLGIEPGRNLFKSLMNSIKRVLASQSRAC